MVSFRSAATVYVANYSLLYRLLNRPQEDRDRLLSDVIVMTPDTPESEDWRNTLAALIAVAPGIFQIDPSREGSQFHLYCAGLKRAAAKLLAGGYRIARGQRPDDQEVIVTMAHIHAAYRSIEYSAHRADTEIITQQFILGTMTSSKRRDLWCPLGSPEVIHSALSDEMRKRRDQRVAEEIQRAVATKDERKAVEAHAQLNRVNGAGAVVKLPKAKRPSLETLKANAASLRDL